MKVYGKKELALHIAVYAFMILAGIVSLARGSYAGLVFFLMVGLNGREALPRYFDPEKYEKHRRREKFEKEALHKRFGIFAPVVRLGPLILALAALLLYVFFSGPIFTAVVVALIVAAIVLMYVQKRMLEDFFEETY